METHSSMKRQTTIVYHIISMNVAVAHKKGSSNLPPIGGVINHNPSIHGHNLKLMDDITHPWIKWKWQIIITLRVLDEQSIRKWKPIHQRKMQTTTVYHKISMNVVKRSSNMPLTSLLFTYSRWLSITTDHLMDIIWNLWMISHTHEWNKHDNF